MYVSMSVTQLSFSLQQTTLASVENLVSDHGSENSGVRSGIAVMHKEKRIQAGFESSGTWFGCGDHLGHLIPKEFSRKVDLHGHEENIAVRFFT